MTAKAAAIKPLRSLLSFPLEDAERGNKILIGSILLLASFTLIVVCMMPLILLSASYVQRHKAFPVIAELGSHWTAAFTRFNNSRLLDRGGQKHERMRQVRFERAKYPGISIIEPVADWTEYDGLVFKLYSNYDHPIRMTLRIHDELHDQSHSDRYNIGLVVEPGSNSYEIALKDVEQAPLNRKMDMTAIAGLILFANSLDKPVTLGVSAIRLVRDR